MKTKRKALSTRYKLSKSWNENDALLALKAEEVNARKLVKDIVLVIRFPDPEISREIVKCYSPNIESVHFQLNYAPRYCLAHLKTGADIKKTMNDISKIPFGTGYLTAEIKETPSKVHTTKLNEIDPFTLYVGNLPTTIACQTLKDHFPDAARIDIGFAQRMKYTRYAFIRYIKAQQAIDAYKRTLDTEIGGRTLTIRFRRLTAAGEGRETENHDDMHDDILSQTAVASEVNLSQECPQGIPTIDSSQENDKADDVANHNINEINSVTGKNSTETEENPDVNNITMEESLPESSDNTIPISFTENINTVQEKCDTLLTLKPDPDADPADKVIRNNTTNTLFEAANNNVKQEKENLALHMEFFDKPNSQNNSSEKSNRSEIVSLPSTSTDETDTLSTVSANSLEDLLRTCQKQHNHKNDIENIERPPAKRYKVSGDVVLPTVKREPLESDNALSREDLPLSSKNSITQKTLKQEPNENIENINNVRAKKSSTQKSCAHRNKKNCKKKEEVATANNPEDSSNNDVVPQTALFFRSDYQNTLAGNMNDCDYDEFYETIISSSLKDIKTEPSDALRRTMLENNENIKQNAKSNRNSTISCKIQVQKQSNNMNDTTISHACYVDDDVVPPTNLLGSYEPSQNHIKREMEHSDIFAVPFSKNQLNTSPGDCSNNNNDSTASSNCESDDTEISISNIIEDNDDDVIIISDNLKCHLQAPSLGNSNLTNFFMPKQTDLLSFKDKPIFVATTKNDILELIDRNHLDRLYDQLDADSDNEL